MSSFDTFQLIRGALRPSLAEGAPSLGEREGEADPVACKRDKAAGENETYHGLVDSACTLRPFRSNTSSKSVSQRTSVPGLLPRGSTSSRDAPRTDQPWDRLLSVILSDSGKATFQLPVGCRKILQITEFHVPNMDIAPVKFSRRSTRRVAAAYGVPSVSFQAVRNSSRPGDASFSTRMTGYEEGREEFSTVNDVCRGYEERK
ncbi:hypothetical protein WN48_06789 [Eufriesea mexicana]|uniref:Uncharacterized protein n=1 Tax=Eufriesea mexicana TaxID=516756 RepID=A0A310SJE8_9HYME|nr:hypothetical protein WN48_06789 [Eufriesea mexicana]